MKTRYIVQEAAQSVRGAWSRYRDGSSHDTLDGAREAATEAHALGFRTRIVRITSDPVAALYGWPSKRIIITGGER